ncbi:MAG: hypothetical protein ACK4XJ_10355 [Fimbriimonadaceae bacterium]
MEVPTPWSELIGLLGAFVAAVFALMQKSMGQHRALLERFMGFLESGLTRREEVDRRFEAALRELSDTVRDNSALVARILDALPSEARRR